LQKLQNRWTYITIDEYQDTNAAQYEIARLLAGTKRNICVVGDIDQNIYSWRGADIEHLLNFEVAFPGATSILLEQNYRSTRTILAAANAVIAKNIRRKEKNLFTENETGQPIHFFSARNEIEEAWHVAEEIKTLVLNDGIHPGDVAVLYRENFQSRVLEEALLRYEIPYRVLGVRFFERAEVKDILSYLRAALNPKSRVDLSRIISTPPRGIGKTTLDKILVGESLTGAAAEKVKKFRETLLKIKHAIETLPASEAVRFTMEASGIETMLQADSDEGQERLGNLQELVNLAVRYDDVPSPGGIERLLEEAALQSEQDSLRENGERAAVSLMTVHASKGLEFDAVFVTGLEQGLFPSTREAEDRDNEEERRLFYVAMTRARKRLFLSYAHERMKYGTREPSIPSEFFEDIDERLMLSYKKKRGLLDDAYID
jgi:DNA helicase-2/ATP-dependent DNA helicase PcrA